MKRTFFTALALCFFVPAAADHYEDYVRAALNQRSAYHSDRYVRLHNMDTVDLLSEGRAATYTLTLAAGRTYRIVGVCDQDCDDLDLELRDENGNLISRDQSDDDIPFVDVTPKWTGSFKLKITMERCAGNSECVYGMTVLRRR